MRERLVRAVSRNALLAAGFTAAMVVAIQIALALR